MKKKLTMVAAVAAGLAAVLLGAEPASAVNGVRSFAAVNGI